MIFPRSSKASFTPSSIVLIITYRSSSVKIPIQNQDFRHSSNSIVVLLRRAIDKIRGFRVARLRVALWAYSEEAAKLNGFVLIVRTSDRLLSSLVSVMVEWVLKKNYLYWLNGLDLRFLFWLLLEIRLSWSNIRSKNSKTPSPKSIIYLLTDW